MKNLEIKQHSKQAIIQFSIYDFKMLKTLGKNFSMTFMSLLPKAAQSYLQKYYNIINQMQEMWQQGKP
jgi:hypothetical protein